LYFVFFGVFSWIEISPCSLYFSGKIALN